MNKNQVLDVAELTVRLRNHSYPIWMGSGLLARIEKAFQLCGISTHGSIFILTDDCVAPLYLQQTEQRLRAAGYQVHCYIVPAGETSKSLQTYEQCITAMLNAGCDRHSTIVALGGGVVGDLAGFVAATYMRGIRFIQIPTTILTHDSSVGGKVAVNHSSAKNIIGAFHQPEMVLYDTSTLLTLPDREVRSGLAEMIKHGLIWDESFVNWCEAQTERLLAKEEEALTYGLFHGCAIKAAIVSKDEREMDLRALLNFGHTIGHALEVVAGYGQLLHHGEAVSIGMVGAARLAVHFGEDAQIAIQIEALLKKCGLPVTIPKQMGTDQIMQAMMHDKKFKGGKTLFIVPTAIGRVVIRENIPIGLIADIINDLKN